MIPSRLIFIWFGRTFPYGNLLALRAARRGFRPAEILLVADDPDALRRTLEENAGDIAAWPELRLMEADLGWFDGLPHGAGAIAREVFTGKSSPATKANLVRLAALYKLGGVYLDFDALTVAAPERLDALRARAGFCGTEHVALPADLFGSRNPLRWTAAGLRLAARQLCAVVPGGWRAFQAIEHLYPAEANNAVVGATAGHPFLDLCFRLMAELPPAERFRRFRLGTHLLQRAARASAPGAPGIAFDVLPPAHFYPLGPEISAHWFRRGTARHLDALLRPETTVVHWYNSVESRLGGSGLTEDWVKTHPDTAFAELVRRWC